MRTSRAVGGESRRTRVLAFALLATLASTSAFAAGWTTTGGLGNVRSGNIAVLLPSGT